MKLPTLYKVDSKGKIREWSVQVIDGKPAQIIVTHGAKGGKLQEKITFIDKGKNIGKANETTILEQAQAEAKSKWLKQQDKCYAETIGEPEFRPMLAHRMDKYPNKVKYPCYVQPKLDGCLSGESLIYTKEYGYKPIKWLVENKIECKVKCYNESTQKSEYKPIKSWFENRDVDENIEWFQIELKTGEILNLTGNHKVYLPDLQCWRRVDELNGDENLMIYDKNYI